MYSIMQKKRTHSLEYGFSNWRKKHFSASIVHLLKKFITIPIEKEITKNSFLALKKRAAFTKCKTRAERYWTNGRKAVLLKKRFLLHWLREAQPNMEFNILVRRALTKKGHNTKKTLFATLKEFASRSSTLKLKTVENLEKHHEQIRKLAFDRWCTYIMITQGLSTLEIKKQKQLLRPAFESLRNYMEQKREEGENHSQIQQACVQKPSILTLFLKIVGHSNQQNPRVLKYFVFNKWRQLLARLKDSNKRYNLITRFNNLQLIKKAWKSLRCGFLIGEKGRLLEINVYLLQLNHRRMHSDMKV